MPMNEEQVSIDEAEVSHVNRCRLILLSDKELMERRCWSTLGQYGVIKTIKMSSDLRAAFVEFECEHAPLLAKRCFEYAKVNKWVPMPGSVVAATTGCTPKTFVLLQEVPSQLSTDAIHNHFSQLNNGRKVTIYRPATDDPSSVVLVELSRPVTSPYYIDKRTAFQINDGINQFQVCTLPELEQLAKIRRVFENDGCWKCHVVRWRSMAEFEDGPKGMNRLLRFNTPMQFLTNVLDCLAQELLPNFYRHRMHIYRNFFRRVGGNAETVNNTMRRTMGMMGKHELLAWTLREVERALRGRSLAQVLIFGNGHFDRPMEHGSTQLALALGVADKYPSAPVYYQEPRMNENERAWLEKRGVIVRKQTSMEPPEMSEIDGCRLVFFMHSPIDVMDEMLRNGLSAAPFIFVGNDYPNQTDEEFWKVEIINFFRKFSAVREFAKRSTMLPLPAYDPHPHAFGRNTALITPPEGIAYPAPDRCTIL